MVWEVMGTPTDRMPLAVLLANYRVAVIWPGRRAPIPAPLLPFDSDDVERNAAIRRKVNTRRKRNNSGAATKK
jgi:hypothetical protein